jgi:peptidoglycan hydrolase-like protein with peptidoglycan-binding domain
VDARGQIVEQRLEALDALAIHVTEPLAFETADEALQAVYALLGWLQRQDVASQLHAGSSNREAVAALQRVLEELGAAKLAADGRYGPATRHAVRSFAERHGLRTGGRSVTPELAALLQRALHERYGAALRAGNPPRA